VPVHQPEARAARLKDLVKNRVRFSAFELGEQAMERFFRRLAGFRPHYCYGYPSLMAEFCRYLKITGRSLNHLPLKALIGTGEYLYPQERELLTEVGGAPVVDEYGCTEVGLVAFQCEQGAMHVMASNIHLEVIKDCRPVLDEEGDIYVTELHAGYCPFVRYGLGDRGLLSSERCRCGRALPVLRILSGRKDDYVLTPEGRKIYDAIFAYTLKEGVDQFRAVQHAPDRIVIDLKPDRSFTPELGARYLAELARLIGPSVRIDLNLVASIERERSGKLRYFINRIGAGTAGEG
jgi:phenylacetate-CoA ligase